MTLLPARRQFLQEELDVLLARARYARQHDEVTYVTVLEWANIDASTPTSTRDPAWRVLGAPPPPGVVNLFGHPLEVDTAKAEAQAVSARVKPATVPFDWELPG